LFKYLIFGVCLFFSCSNFQPNQSKSGQVLLSDSRIKTISDRISQKTEPTYSAFQHLIKFVNKNIDREPVVPQHWYVPFYYEDPQGHRKAKESLQNDANAAYGLALYYRLTKEEMYANKSLEIINAWTSGIKTFNKVEDSKLSFSYHFPAVIFAADLLRDQDIWANEEQKAFELFLRSAALPMNTMSRKNNWGNWGLVLASSIGAYLHDDSLLKDCADRWKYFIEHQIAEDGTLPHEVKRNDGRSGIWYSHFCLMPQTIAGEILKQNGFSLYEYESQNKKTLEVAFHKIAYWTTHPSEFFYWEGPVEQLGGQTYFSYFEILNSIWPDANAAIGLDKTRPQTANHSAPFLTLTHGGF